MEENYQPEQEYFSNIITRLRDMEEKQRRLRDRTLLIGQNLVEDKETTFEEIRELKKTQIKLKEENLKMKEFIQRMSEQMSELARKEEVMILQRQFDIIKPLPKKQNR